MIDAMRSPPLHLAVFGSLCGVAGLTAPALAAPSTCAAPSHLVERFMPADCETCWRDAAPLPRGRRALDWIAPSAQGDDAPMVVAARPEAADRLARLGGPDDAVAANRENALPERRAGWQLSVEDGPAWNGYIGIHLKSQSPRRGAASHDGPYQAYMALVELLPAGSEGSNVARQLVRAVAGPLSLPSGDAGEARAPVARSEMRALRLPDGVQPERLASVAWIEDARGRIVAFAQTRCAAP